MKKETDLLGDHLRTGVNPEEREEIQRAIDSHFYKKRQMLEMASCYNSTHLWRILTELHTSLVARSECARGVMRDDEASRLYQEQYDEWDRRIKILLNL